MACVEIPSRPRRLLAAIWICGSLDVSPKPAYAKCARDTHTSLIHACTLESSCTRPFGIGEIDCFDKWHLRRGSFETVDPRRRQDVLLPRAYRSQHISDPTFWIRRRTCDQPQFRSGLSNSAAIGDDHRELKRNIIRDAEFPEFSATTAALPTASARSVADACANSGGAAASRSSALSPSKPRAPRSRNTRRHLTPDAFLPRFLRVG